MYKAQQNYSVPGREATVLSIDDDPQIGMLISTRLEPFGVNVMSAHFGTHGMWLAKQELPHVIITDFQMPQGDGGCVIEWLQSNQRTAHIPIIVLTGRNEPGLESKLRQRGAAHFLRKPASFRDLFQILQGYILFEPTDSSIESEPVNR